MCLVTISRTDEIAKVYPKPGAALGRIVVESEKLIFKPAPAIDTPDVHYPIIANVVSPVTMENDDFEILKEIILFQRPYR